MRRMKVLAAAAAIMAAMAPAAAFAGSADSGMPTVGERAQAMGNAFVAVANDASAIYWNPAGLALVKNRQAQISHTDLYGWGIDYNHVAYADGGYGASWSHIDASDFLMGGGDWTDDMYTIAGSRQVDPQTYIGAAVKWRKQKYNPPATIDSSRNPGNGITAYGLSGDGFSVDVGLLYLVDEATTVGATIQDLFGELKTQNTDRDVSADKMNPNISVGFSRKSDNDSLYAIQISDLGEESTVHFGIEKKLQEEFVVRAGVDDEVVTAGLGFTRNQWQINYSFKNKSGLGLERTQRFGAVVYF